MFGDWCGVWSQAGEDWLIAELLVRMLRRRDDRLSSLGSVLARLTHCLSSLTLLTKDIAQADSEPALDLALVEQKIELNKIFIQGNTGNTSYLSKKLKLSYSIFSLPEMLVKN